MWDRLERHERATVHQRPAAPVPIDPRMRALQRFGGNRAAVEALGRVSGARLQRCSKCVELVKESKNPDPQREDLMKLIAPARKTDRASAVKLAREWNTHHPESPVTPQEFKFLMVRDHELAAAVTITNNEKGDKSEEIQPSKSDASVKRLQDFTGVLEDLVEFGSLDSACHYSSSPHKYASNLLHEIKRMLMRPQLVDEKLVKAFVLRMQELAGMLAGENENLQREILAQARKLVMLGFADDDHLPECIELFKNGDSAQLKGLVGEYLGRLAASRRFAKTGEVQFTHELHGVLMLEILPIGGYEHKLPKTNAVVKHAAPILPMQGSLTHVGKTVGEVDTLLCQQGNNGLMVVGALESKGGNNDMQLVREQTQKINSNLAKIGSTPTQFCFAERHGNKYRNINANFDLTVLANIGVFSTGPIRKNENDQFDISLGISLEVMECLLGYLASVEPGWWGWSPTIELRSAVANVPGDLATAVDDLPANVMDQYV